MTVDSRIERFIGVFFAAACVQAVPGLSEALPVDASGQIGLALGPASKAREATMPNSMPMGKMSDPPCNEVEGARPAVLRGLSPIQLCLGTR